MLNSVCRCDLCIKYQMLAAEGCTCLRESLATLHLGKEVALGLDALLPQVSAWSSHRNKPR